MTDRELEQILLDPGIVRNHLKVYSVRKNAKVALEIIREFGSLDQYFWDSLWLRHREERSDPENKKGIPLSGWIASQAHNDRTPQSFPVINNPHSLSEVPVETDISRAISKDLKKRGMSFVGSTIIYAWMQAVGMVDDHIYGCISKSA
jgi:DNA-3-methyladenine glycosylase I